MEVDQRQIISGPNFWSPIEIHIESPTVAKNIFGKCCHKAPSTVLTAKKEHAQYGGARTSDVHETNFLRIVGVDNKRISHVHCKLSHMEIF